MAKEHLTAKGWKAISKEHKCPDEKLLEALEAYEEVAEGEEYAEQVEALDKINELVYDLQKKKGIAKEIEKYLAQIEKDIKSPLMAAKEGVRLEASMSKKREPEKESDEDEGEDEGDGTLEGALKIVKTRGENMEKALSFIACQGKPLALILAKRIGQKHKKAVKDKSGGSKFFEGKCIFEANAYTFCLETAPPRGLAKQIKAGMYAECGKQHKVRVRDLAGTAILDDESDELPPDEQPVQGTPAGTETKPVVGTNVQAAKARIDMQAALDKFTNRLTTLIKTTAYGLKQESDEAVRILTEVETELEESVRELEAKHRGIAIPPAVGELQRRIVAGKNTVITKLNTVVQEHAKDWLTELVPLVKDGATPPPTPKQLIEAITRVEKGMVLDKAMLARLKQKPSELYAQIEKALTKARIKYEESFPKRTKESDPIDPPKANRPAVGNLGDEFKKIVDRSEGAMANDTKPSVEDLRAMVEQIDTQLPKDLKASLKNTYKTWDGVKDHYKKLLKTDKTAATTFMSNYWWFRRRVVDDLMAELQDKYDFKWASVGSANLESDYDISIKSHGKNRDEAVYDWQIVNEFNKKISSDYGCQPGTLFDTNLYASAVVEAPKDDEAETEETKAVKKDMKAMAESGQDVGALMKMRRYMDWEDFESYKEGILADINKEIKAASDPDEVKALNARLQAAKRQFEEADDLYFMAIYKQLTKAGVKLELDLSPAGQKTLIEESEKFEHESADKLMETNNDLYVEAMVEVRKIEEELKKTSPDDADKRNALFAKLKTAQADATYFAAEAYHSEGPFKHIVEARQSSDAKVKNDPEMSKLSDEEKKKKVDELTTKAIDAMSVTQMMQSFNENLGDLLKDLRHYADKSELPALGFFRSSKYFERLCDAMDIIGKKLKGSPVQSEFQAIRLADKTPAQMRAALGKLVKVRGGAGFKSKADFPDDPEAVDDPEKEKEAFVIAEMNKAMPKVKTLKDLASAVTTTGGQVNSILRKAAAGDSMIAGNENPYFA